MPKAKKVTKSNSKSSIISSNFDLLSWKVLVPALLIFASIGGYYVYSTSAASSYLFVNNYSKMNGGTVKKISNTNYRLAGRSYGNVQSRGYFKENNTSYFCWHFKLIDASTRIKLSLINPKTGKYIWSGSSKYDGKKGETYNICSGRVKAGTSVFSDLRTEYGTVGVDTFYGKD